MYFASERVHFFASLTQICTFLQRVFCVVTLSDKSKKKYNIVELLIITNTINTKKSHFGFLQRENARLNWQISA
jgi:hypothetical protein